MLRQHDGGMRPAALLVSKSLFVGFIYFKIIFTLSQSNDSNGYLLRMDNFQLEWKSFKGSLPIRVLKVHSCKLKKPMINDHLPISKVS